MEDVEKFITDITRDEERRLKHFALLDRETRGILKPISLDCIRDDEHTLTFPLFGSFEEKQYHDYKISYSGLIQQTYLSSTFWQVSPLMLFPEDRPEIQTETQTLLEPRESMKLLEDFLRIAVIDISSRGGVDKLEKLEFSSLCDKKVIDAIKNFIVEYGPLFFCSEHNFCFIQTSSLNNKCAWDFKEHIEDYVNLSRLLYAIALCNPRRFKGLENDKQGTSYSAEYRERLKEIINKFQFAKMLFEQLKKVNYAQINQWFLPGSSSYFWDHLLSIQKAIEEGQPKQCNGVDISRFQIFIGAMDHDLIELMGSNPLTFLFQTGGGIINNINDPLEVDIFYNLGIGIGRILLIQFYQELIGSGRLIVCSKCFKPYLRKQNRARGRNFCPNCSRKK